MLLLDVTKNGFIKGNKIYVTDLYNVILEEDDTDTDNNPGILDTQSKSFDKLFKKYKRDFPYLDSNLFIEVLKDINGVNSKYEKMRDSERKKIRTALNKKASLMIKVPISKVPSTEIDKIVKRDSQGDYGFSLANVVLEVPEETRDSFVDSEALFNNFHLSERIPFISISKTGRKALIKVSSTLKNKPDLVKSWSTSERSKSGDYEESKKVVMKMPRNIMLKVLVRPEKYATVNIFKNGKVVMRITWVENEHGDEKSLKEAIKIISKEIQKINELRRLIFTDTTKKIPVPTYENSLIRSIDTNLRFNLDFDKVAIESTLKNKKELQEFVKHELFTKSRDEVKLQYKRVSKLIADKDVAKVILEEESDKKLIIRIRTNPLYTSSTSVNIKNATNINQANVVYDFVVALFRSIYKSEDIPVSTPSVIQKSVSKLKALQLAGIPIDGRDCQKKFQPIIASKEERPDLPRKESYAVFVKGKRLVCDDPNIPYPGFQQGGKVCCFKKDQRGKPIFMDYYVPEGEEAPARSRRQTDITKIIERFNLDTDKYILKDKLLQPGQIGVLPDKIKYLFKKIPSEKKSSFLRIGVEQRSDQFLNAIMEAVRKHLEKDDKIFNNLKDFKNILIEYLSKNRFISLENGNIAKSISMTHFKENILRPNQLNENVLLDLVSRASKVNVWILSEKLGNVLCRSGDPQEFNKNVFILKKEIPETKTVHYEPIFEFSTSKNSDVTEIKRVFSNNSEIAKLIRELYMYSCESTPIVQTEYTEPLPAKKTFDILTKNDITVSHQIMNPFKQIIFLIVDFKKRKLIIPVKPSGAVDNEDVKIMKDVTDFKLKITPKILGFYTKLFQQTNLMLRPVSQIIMNDDLVAVVLENGLFVPSNPTSRINEFPISDINYYEYIDAFLANPEQQVVDARMKTMMRLDYYTHMLHQIRYEFSTFINDPANKPYKNDLKDTIESVTKTRSQKTKEIKDMVKKIISRIIVTKKDSDLPFSLSRDRHRCSGSTCDKNPFCGLDSSKKCKAVLNTSLLKKEELTDIIVTELVNDTYVQSIINGQVDLYITKQEEFTVRPGEIILMNIDDILKWSEGKPVRRRSVIESRSPERPVRQRRKTTVN